jgi:cation:H+ antiporter
MLWPVGVFLAGLVLVVAASERLVEATVGVSRGAGVSAFLISVVFIGFDAENLGVGVMANVEQAAGIALGTVVGAAMVAVALAFGLTAVIVPLEFGRIPRRVLALPVAAVALLAALAADGRLSRLDGGVLLAGYAVAVALLVTWERRGVNRGVRVAPEDAVEEEAADEGLLVSTAWFVACLVGIVVGGEWLVRGARPIIGALGWTDTAFGMTVLALLVSGEELARELPAALKGRPDVSFGNVVGSALAFFGFNAGVIALVRPVPVDAVTLTAYLPVCVVTVLTVTALAATGRIARWGGALLVVLYAAFCLLPSLL